MKHFGRPLWVGLCAVLLGVTGCGLSDDPDALDIRAEGDAIIIQGAIDETAPLLFAELQDANPGIRKLVLAWVPGSLDDDSNLELARQVHALKMTTVVPPGGMIASGGTDLFLAGAHRIAAADACIGVHSWAEGGLFGSTDGRDVPADDPRHRIYHDYFAEVGAAPGFYDFTMQAADADSMHWMTEAEMNRFRMTSGRFLANPVGGVQDRCEMRADQG